MAELSGNIRDQGDGILSGAIAVLLLTNVAMFLRNVVLLGIFAKTAVPTALLPLALMAMLAILFTWLSRDRSGTPVKSMQLSSPVSLKRVAKFGVLFIILAAAGFAGAAKFWQRWISDRQRVGRIDQQREHDRNCRIAVCRW